MAAALVLNYDPNAYYDQGPNSAGAGRLSNQEDLQVGEPTRTGLRDDGVTWTAHLRTGFSAAGVPRYNHGPNVAGAPRNH